MRRGSSRFDTEAWCSTRTPPLCRPADQAARGPKLDCPLDLASRLDCRYGMEIPVYLVELGVVGEAALRDGDQRVHERLSVGGRKDDARTRLSHDSGRAVVAGQGQDRAAGAEVFEHLSGRLRPVGGGQEHECVRTALECKRLGVWDTA